MLNSQTKRELWKALNTEHPALAQTLTELAQAFGKLELLECTTRTMYYLKEERTPCTPARKWLEDGVALARHHLSLKERAQLDKASAHIKKQRQAHARDARVEAPHRGAAAHRRNRSAWREQS